MPSSALSTISKPRASSSDVARQWLVKFAEICQREFTPALADIWAEQLRDIAPDVLDRACDRLMRRWTSGFLPVPGSIREIAAEIQQIEERREREERDRRNALRTHQRAIAYAGQKQQENLLAPPPESAIDTTSPAPIRETPSVADVEGRAAELERQKRLIVQKHPNLGNMKGIPPELRPE